MAPTTEKPDGHSFDVLVAGATPPPNPGELIESRAMESLLEQAKAMYDLVVIDTPPLTAVSDAFPLLTKVDQWAARMRPKILALLLRSVRIGWEHAFVRTGRRIDLLPSPHGETVR